MAGKIPQSFIDDVLNRTDIVDLIGSRIKLKKTGLNYQALCPFHDEKSPSFSVNPNKQFYYCFGCGAGGNAISFLMDYDRTDFPQTIESLAKSQGLEVPKEHNPALEAKRQQQATIYDVLEQANTFFQQQLKQHPDKKKAVQYLKGRGLTGSIAKQFQIGFAPDGWDNLLTSYDNSHEAKQQQLLDNAGLCILKPEEKKCYDRFRDRLMFPIRDNRGRTIAFGGRAFGDLKPKYLNSPETPVFHKNNELYGLYESLQANKHLSRLLMVEGYMDVVSLAQYDINWAVATLGTAAGDNHMRKVFRHTSEVIFCFDGDAAGRKAATRALDAVLAHMQAGRKAKFLFLPEGEDPDTLVRRIGTQQFLYLVDDAPTLSDHLFSSLSDDLQLQRADDKAELIHRLLPKIALLQEGSYKTLIVQELADKSGISLDKFEQFVLDDEKKQAKKQALAQHQQAQPPTKLGQPSTQSLANSTINDLPSDLDDYNYADNHVTNKGYNHKQGPKSRHAFSRQEQRQETLKHSRIAPTQSVCALTIFFPEIVKTHDISIPLNEADIAADAGLTLLQQLLDDIKSQENPTSASIIGSWLAKEPQAITPLLAYQLNPNNAELHEQEFLDAIDQLKNKKERKQRIQAIEEISNTKTLNELSDDEQTRFLALFKQENPPENT